MDKKAESISMSVIIIAAIALLVLVILAVLVFRAGGGVAIGTGCNGIGGNCRDDTGDGLTCYENEKQDFTRGGVSGGCKDKQLCCIPITKAESP